MNGRFPVDVSLILLLPFSALAAPFFFIPLLMPDNVHHHLAVVTALVLAVGLTVGILVFRMRRRRRQKVKSNVSSISYD
jgi:nitrate reductase gamma subunit